jgi:hypothetical protein
VVVVVVAVARIVGSASKGYKLRIFHPTRSPLLPFQHNHFFSSLLLLFLGPLSKWMCTTNAESCKLWAK